MSSALSPMTPPHADAVTHHPAVSGVGLSAIRRALGRLAALRQGSYAERHLRQSIARLAATSDHLLLDVGLPVTDVAANPDPKDRIGAPLAR